MAFEFSSFVNTSLKKITNQKKINYGARSQAIQVLKGNEESMAQKQEVKVHYTDGAKVELALRNRVPPPDANATQVLRKFSSYFFSWLSRYLLLSL